MYFGLLTELFSELHTYCVDFIDYKITLFSEEEKWKNNNDDETTFLGTELLKISAKFLKDTASLYKRR